MQSRGRSSSSVALTETSSGSTRRSSSVCLVRLSDSPATRTALRCADWQGRPESRLRVGDWRVIVELDVPERTIVIARVLPRGRAYDR